MPAQNRIIAQMMVGIMFLAATAIYAADDDERAAAPRFRAKTLAGENFNNEALQGKVVLLEFWTTWCPYCRSEQALIDEIHQEFSDQGLIVLAIDVGESKKKVKKYLDQSPRSCRIVLTEDTNLAAMYAATQYPIYVAIDREGKIVGTQRGARGEKALHRMLQGAGLGSDSP